MNYYPFDSRNKLYRSKIGALAEGETLRLRVLLHKDAHVHEAFLIIRNDNESYLREVHMNGGEWLGDYRFYECDITLEKGLFWYRFRYTSDYGNFYVTKTETSLGIVSHEGGSWQQTVFAKDFNTPDWIKGGIIYQIFPDRFYNSGEKKENVPDDRYICTDFSKQPEYRRNENEKCRLGNDYYGGDLKGIEQKLDYIESLGVNCIYLNPIFEAHSNHRYNTANYFEIDSVLGTQKDLCSLIKKADKRNIKIILDGVFSHTGDDSIYFNKHGRYDSIGAYNSKESPYYNWYKFTEYPDKYSAWWGVDTLPETDENNPDFSEFVTGENGVLKYWLKKGIGGWRLDVADELPDAFLDRVRAAIKSENNDSYLLGEVWEDATNKISYDKRRRFLLGNQLDSVMNYPFANAIVDFVKYGDGDKLVNTVLSIAENYPPQSLHTLMNHIGTHDTARILTRLGTDKEYKDDRYSQSVNTLSREEYEYAIRLLKIAAVLQYTLPGVPSLYYGDEAGLTGYGDPFCRAGYPWGRENTQLINFYKALGNTRRKVSAFKNGEFIPLFSSNGVIAYKRETAEQSVIIAVNRENRVNEFPQSGETEILFGNAKCELGKTVLDPFGFAILLAKSN